MVVFPEHSHSVSLCGKCFLVCTVFISWLHGVSGQSGSAITTHFNNPKDFEGWNCGKIQKCGSYGNICGGYGVKGKGTDIKKTFHLPAGKYSVKLDFIKIDSWDGEGAYVSVNGKKCWTKTKIYLSTGSNQCGISGRYKEERYPVACTVTLSGSGKRPLTVRVWTSLDEGLQNESFGIDNVVVQPQKIRFPIIEQFNNPKDSKGWNCGKVQKCGNWGNICGGYGVKGQGSDIKKTFHLPAGKYSVKLDFIKIDSWDGENAYVSVNGKTCWTKRGISYATGTATCGHDGHTDWKEARFPVTGCTVTLSGSGDRPLTVRAWSSLNQDANDESFGIDNVVIQKLSTAIIEQFNNPKDFEGWNCGKVQKCGNWGNICGGYGVKGQGSDIKKTFHLPAGTYSVKLAFLKIDSWDGENAYVSVNGKKCWTKNGITHMGKAVCGQTGFKSEQRFPVACKVTLSGSGNRPLTVRVWTTLNQGANDESFGIDNVVVQKLRTKQKPSDGSTWTLMFRQTAPYYLHPATKWLSVNPTNPSSPNYSILNTLGDKCKYNGKYEFKLVWPRRKGANYNIWRQSTNPVTDKVPVRGYEAVDVKFTAQGWGGLENGYLQNRGNPPALLDGTVNHPNWFYAVGTITSWGGGIPGASSAESQVELYAKCKAGSPKPKPKPKPTGPFSKLKLQFTANHGSSAVCVGRLRLQYIGMQVVFPAGTKTQHSGLWSRSYPADNLIKNSGYYCSENGSFKNSKGNEVVLITMPKAVSFDSFSLQQFDGMGYSPKAFTVMGLGADGKWVQLHKETTFSFARAKAVATFRVTTPGTIGSDSTCPRSYSGGCGNWGSKTLNKNFREKRYTVSECAYKCKSTSGCGGFFLHTKFSYCLLVKAGCQNDHNSNYAYYSMATCTVANCGAPPVDWANVVDQKAPAGWQVKGFSGNVGDARKCKHGWNAYAGGRNQGQLYATMKGYGRATVKYRDCWGEGFVGLYVNGKKRDQSSTNNGLLRTFSFDFENGDVLMFKDEGHNSVIQIESIQYQCKKKAVKKKLTACRTSDLAFLANSYRMCGVALFGIGDPCDCLCTFPQKSFNKLSTCGLPDSKISVHDQWRACAAKNKSCGHTNGGVVVVHGRSLRGE